MEVSYLLVRFMQKFDRIENMEQPADAPIRLRHAIENRSGSGVMVRFHEAVQEKTEVNGTTA